MKTLMMTAVMMCSVTAAAVAGASDSADDWGEGPAEPESEGDADEQFLAGEEEEPDIPPPAEEKDKGLHEDPDDKIYALGVRLRWIMIPDGFIKMFGVDMMQSSANQRGLPLISNVGVGPEFIFRRDGLDITAAIWYAGLGWNPVSIKNEDDGEGAWEVIENSWQTILFTADFIWSTSFTDWFALTYGLGIGFGIKWGEITETEASTSSGYLEKCNTYNDPVGDYGCSENPANNSEADYGTEIWPAPIIPWFEVLVGMRFKPHRNVSIYVDGGFNFGFQVGLRTQYIF